jgi:glycosyltransferase involved in cell wall biosynthesis
VGEPKETRKPVKILVGMPASDSWGGPIASEPPFVEALKELGVGVVTEVYVYGDKEKPTPFFSRIGRVLRTAFRFRQLVRDTQPDLLHLNSAFDLRTILRDSISIFIMRPGRAKIFIKLHGSAAENFVNASLATRMLIGYLKNNVDGFGYFTQEELEAFLKLGFDGSKFFPVKNAITIQSSLPEDFVRPQKEPSDIFNLLFVSRFIAAKGLLETIEACNELRNRGMRFRLFCVGDGEARKDAEAAVGRLGLGRAVTFTGYIPEDEVTRLFFESDIFVFPTSHIEGFPLVLFKAVVVGMPVVTTQIRAAADYLSEPDNCLFCTKQPTDIADKLEKLITDKDLRSSMSARNLEYEKHLTPDVIAKEFMDIYEKLVRSK